VTTLTKIPKSWRTRTRNATNAGTADRPEQTSRSAAMSKRRSKGWKTPTRKWRILRSPSEPLLALSGMKDQDPIEHTSIYEPLREDLHLPEKELEKLLTDDDEPFVARDVRLMLKARGPVDEITEDMVTYWQDRKIPDLRVNAAKAGKTHKALIRRYKAAVERLRLSRGLPEDAALEKIQRYEAHLERGLHKALDRLQTLQKGRGVNPTTINLAVVQGTYREPEMASFGNSSIEAAVV
jgi:hypothetical protein